MGGDHSIDSSFVHLAEYRLRDCSSGGRFGAGPELIDENEGLAVGRRKHCLHVLQEGTVGAEVVFEVLVVADADHDSFEHGKLRNFGSRYEHAPLEHVLQKSGSLEADGLAPCIGT